MKLLASTLILIAFLGFLAYTNPKMDSYDRFINQLILGVCRTFQWQSSVFGKIAASADTQI